MCPKVFGSTMDSTRTFLFQVLDHFGGVFTMMTPAMFRAVFTATIDYVVERLNKNPLLQTVANYLLANRTTSSIFATILVEYLLDRMDEMGCECR